MPRKTLLVPLVVSLALVLVPTASATASRLIAPATACPNQDALGAAPALQQEAMLCMTNFARESYGEPPLSVAPELELSAADKSQDILRCNSFSHTACGREFTYWIRASGYLSTQCWRAGENLAWGAGAYGSVGSIFRAWMRSTAHRENILGDFDQVGIALETGVLAGQSGTHIWTQHFGSHCEPPAPQA
jgi:uncharacterized protein YkwD